jgi:hypothetical protein
MSMLFDHIEAYPRPKLQEIDEAMDWRRSAPDLMGETPRFVLQPAPDEAYTRHLLDESLCPLDGELLDGPECGHDWAAIADREQGGTPIIDMRGNR